MGKNGSGKLSAVAINSKKQPGYYGDGDGLYLQVSPSGSKSWIFRFSLNKKSREMGLGSLATYGLSEAREQARKQRQLLQQGLDPIEIRRMEIESARQKQANKKSFEECSKEYHLLHAHGWKNVKHTDQWINTLATYAFPTFGNKDVSDVSKSDILKALEPIWTTKPETASRVRQRIRIVLDWSAARDYRLNHDPHLWDQIARSLPKTKDIKKPTHFAACKYSEINDVIKTIQQSSSTLIVKAALQFIIFTATRSGEVRGAKWSEIDLRQKRWIIPGIRMKSGREHRIPLSDQAIEILTTLPRTNHDPESLVFPSEKGRAYSDMTFTMLLRRLGYEFTVHGFRSTFRDWSAEKTTFPREVCEAALAHIIKDSTEAAYFRSDLFEKRRELMNNWACHCIAS